MKVNSSTSNRIRSGIVLLALLLVVAACSSDSGDDAPAPSSSTLADSPSSTMADDMDMDMGGSGDYSFGEPMDSSAADRTVEITAMDDFSFSPDSVTVGAGETVTFKVTNAGVIPHDFTLGDAAMQDEHEAEMAEMEGDMMHNEPNAFSLEPGETKEMTWHFNESGPILFACHQPGHYGAGMKGTVTINS